MSDDVKTSGPQQVSPGGTVISYPRKMTQGNRVITVASPLAHLQAEKSGFVDAAGVSLLKTTFPRTVKNAQGKILVASTHEAYLSYLNDGYSDAVSGLA